MGRITNLQNQVGQLQKTLSEKNQKIEQQRQALDLARREFENQVAVIKEIKAQLAAAHEACL